MRIVFENTISESHEIWVPQKRHLSTQTKTQEGNILNLFYVFIAMYGTISDQMYIILDSDLINHIYKITQQWPLLLTWINFNPTMDK